MNEKQSIFEYIRNLGRLKTVSEQELIAAYREGAGIIEETVVVQSHNKERANIAQILYIIGAAIVFIGIVILVYQNWDVLGSLTKILSTLGSGIAAYVAGTLLQYHKRAKEVSMAFFLISALVLPIGLFITLDIAGLDVQENWVQVLISSLLAGTYALSFLLFRTGTFAVFSILYGTWLFFALTNWIVGGAPAFEADKFYAYRVLLTGLTYIFLGYHFSDGHMHRLRDWLYALGIFIFLGAALYLGGWKPNQSIFWEILYPGLAFGAIFLSIYLKSRSFLIFGSIYLMGYILKITSEYFTDTLGWPLALVITGLVLIAIGYMAFYLNQTYITKKTVVT